MRTLICSAIAAALLIAAAPAQAADGCSFDAYGRVYCLPGAQPGVPYYRGGYYGYDGDPYYQRRYYRHRDYDPGPAIALGIIGAAAGAIASQSRHQHRKRYRYR